MKGSNQSQTGGLEVNAYQDGLQFAYDKDSLPEALYPGDDAKSAAQKSAGLPAFNGNLQKSRGTTFRLSIALVLSVIVAIVAAALTATMALQLSAVKRQLGTCASPLSNQTNSSNSAIMTPTSDCKKMISNYNSIVNHASYDLFCNYNQPNADLMSVWVYTFEDCIRACSSYDFMGTHNGSHCYGVSYKYTIRTDQALQGFCGGNCFLKAMKHNKSLIFDDVGVDSAFLSP